MKRTALLLFLLFLPTTLLAQAILPPGDSNGDGSVTVADVFYNINFLFAGGRTPLGPADVNGDGTTTVADVFYLINYIFAGGPSPRATVAGTAAKGGPIANATMTIKDKNGVIRTASTSSGGKYVVDVTGLSPPFLLRVDLGAGAFLYGIGAQFGTVNVHPYSDLIIQTWYQAEGKSIGLGFSDPVANPAPAAAGVHVIEPIVREVIGKWLVDQGIDQTKFELISTPFDANHLGFDKVLDFSSVTNGTISVSDGVTTQTTTSSVDAATSQVSFSTTTTSGSDSSSSTATVVIPTTSAQQAAIDGVNAALSQLRVTVNNKGAALADSDLIGFFDAAFIDDGFGPSVQAAEFAESFRGVTVDSISVDRVFSYDDTSKIISVGGNVSLTSGGLPVVQKIQERNEGSRFKQQTDGTWRFYGNQRPAGGGLQVEMRTDLDSSGSKSRKSINIDVRAPKDSVQSVSLTGGSIFSNTDIPKSNTTEVDTIQATPTTTITIQKDAFFLQRDLTDFPPPGTEFTFTITLASGGAVTFSVTTRATTTEAITITSPTGHTLADANLGQPLAVTWTLPKTYAVEELDFHGSVFTAPPPQPGFECFSEDVNVPTTATSGTITLPSTCNGQSVTAAGINVSTTGPSGERSIVIYQFR